MPSKYSIKDLERLSGIKAHTLRMWEQRYEILNPERTDTNIRFYSNADLKRILNISLLNNNGYKISNIAKLTSDDLLCEVEKILNNFLKESHQIENLILCLVDMSEEKFETAIQKSILHFGFESTIEQIIFPFLKHIGNLWQTGIINSAQEHYISNLIRQKLIVGIDRLTAPLKAGYKTYLFFLPSQELHEMGLLYTYYLAKAKGHKCLYLGQSLPLEDLASISRSVAPDRVVSIFTGQLQGLDLNAFLAACHAQIEGPEFLISGRLVLDVSAGEVTLPSSRFTVFGDFEGFRKLL